MASATLFVTAKTQVVLAASSAVSSASLYVTGGTGPVPDPVTSWLRVREKPSLAQSIMVATPGGKVYRWGEDDRIADRSYRDLSYGGGVPGGFDQLGCTLQRKANIDYSDLDLFSTIQVLDAGGEVTGEYRLDSAPKTAGNDFVISPNAVGYQAALEDRKDCAMIFVDIDLSHWANSISAQYHYNSSAYTLTSPPSVQSDVTTGAPALFTGIDGAPDNAFPWVVGEYDAGSFVDIGSVYYAWRRNPNTDNALTYYNWDLQLDSVDTFSSPEGTGNLRAAGPGTGTYTAGASCQYATAEWWWSTLGTPSGTWPITYGIYWTMLAVYGNHGLTKRGSESATTAKGFYASDVIQWVVENFTDLNIGTIDATTFVIPQLEFRAPTTPADVVAQTNRFNLYDWFLGPGQKFHYRERGTYGRSWLARVGPSQLEGTGQTSERCITDVLVSYQDVDGTPQTVGPPQSYADLQDASLHDSDTQNPANVAGIEKYATLDMGQVSTAAAAIQVGARFLEEINALDHSGRATLTGHVMNTAGVLFPVWSVQAGDTITFLDAADTSPRRIVKVSKGANSVSIDLDAPPEGTQALLERLGVQWTNLGALGAPEITTATAGSDVIRPAPFTEGANIKYDTTTNYPIYK